MSEKSSTHRLAGVIEKFNRAKGQFDELRHEMDAFFNKEPSPHFSVGEFDLDAWEWVMRFQVREETPLRFGVILGDVVHNLRSALDHLICQVTLLDSDGNADCAKTQFPIASKSEQQFESMADHRIPDLSPEHRAAVKRMQPYNAGDKAPAHSLAVLADLSNADKHRVVNPTYSFLAVDGLADKLNKLLGPESSGQRSPIRGYYVVKRGQRMEHGTPWLRLIWDPREEPPRSVNVDFDFTLGIALGEVGLDAQDFQRLAWDIQTVIQRFLADFPETEFIEP